jgi:hypothetical protein
MVPAGVEGTRPQVLPQDTPYDDRQSAKVALAAA